MQLESPELVVGDAYAGSRAQLRGSRCRTCNDLAVPHLRHGCERCGAPAEQLADENVAASGQVREAIRLHGRGRRAGANIARIQLDAGPVLQVLLVDDQPLPAHGMRVQGVLRTTPERSDTLSLRFETVEVSA